MSSDKQFFDKRLVDNWLGDKCPDENRLDPVTLIDARGWVCPLPLIELQHQITLLGEGQCVELQADDPSVLDDIPDWCEQTGHELLLLKRLDSVMIIQVVKRKLTN